MRAIEAGDAAAARQAAAQHMNNAIKRIEQAEPIFWEQSGVQLASPLVSGLQMRTENNLPVSIAIKE